MKSKFFNKPVFHNRKLMRPIFKVGTQIMEKKLFGFIPIFQLAFLTVAILEYVKFGHAGPSLCFTILGLANCANPSSIFNTGIPLCDLKKKRIRGVLFADGGVTFDSSDLQSVPAFIQAVKDKTVETRGNRVYPIWDLLQFDDNTGDPATGGIGNLTTATFVTQDASPAFSFGYNGTEARHKKMSAMNGASLDVFFIDEQFAVYGTTDTNGKLKGFSVLQAYADVTKFPVADAVNQYRFRITLGSITEYRENSTYVVTNSGLLSAVGLINVYLAVQSQASNVIKITVVSEGGTDLEPLYGTDLDGLTWTAVNLQTGAAFIVTSVADDSTLDAMTVTLDTTAWTALGSGDKVQVNGPSLSALQGANIKPFEMVSVIVTKP